MPAAKLTPEEFIIVWNRSNSMGHFCERTGYTPITARQRAMAFRKKGIRLKFFGPSLAGAEKLREMKELNEQIRDEWDFDAVLSKYQ